MIRAFAAALEDDDLLVRRGALDILLQSLRIDSVAVKKAAEEDRIILMRAATSVVLRRDLSLNRRIYSWLLGPEEQSQSQVTYLKSHALELLRTTLRVSNITIVMYFMLTSFVRRLTCSVRQLNMHKLDHLKSSYLFWINGR